MANDLAITVTNARCLRRAVGERPDRLRSSDVCVPSVKGAPVTHAAFDAAVFGDGPPGLRLAAFRALVGLGWPHTDPGS